MLFRSKEGRLPDAVIAAVGGGSNAIGMFTDFIDEKGVRLIGVEPAGHGIESGEHGAPLGHAKVGIYFGMKSPLMQTEDGQVEESYSISAGLDFPSVGPQHAYLQSIGRAEYPSITDDEALNLSLIHIWIRFLHSLQDQVLRLKQVSCSRSLNV